MQLYKKDSAGNWYTVNESDLKHGEEIKKVKPTNHGDVVIEMIFSATPTDETQNLRPSIVVSTTPVAINNRITLAEGTTVSLSIEVKAVEGKILPLTETFAVPVKRIGGAVERTVGISFTDGQGSKDITWPSSGEFEITEDLINMHLPKDQHFKFDRLVFSVYE